MPVGLQEDAIDVVDVDGLVGGADGLDQAANAEITGLAQDAVGGADDQVDGEAREGVVAEANAVEFAQDEVAQGVRGEAFGDDRVGDAAFDVVVDLVLIGRPNLLAALDLVWFLGKSSKSSLSLRRLAMSMRWASSRMVVKHLPA